MIEDRKLILPGLAIFLLITAFLWSTHTILSPILLGGILIYLLSEFKDFPFIRRLRIGIAILLFFWVLVNIQGILIPFLVAFLLAYLINPLVDQFEKWHVPRVLSVLLIFLGLLGILGLILAIILPDLAREIQELLIRFPKMLQNGIALAHKHLPKLFALLKIDYLKLEKEFLEEKYPAYVGKLFIQIVKAVLGMGTWLGQLLNLILIPVLTFYFLLDYHRVRGTLLGFVPKKYRSLASFYLWRSNRIVGGYIRGQLIVCTIVGVFTWFGLFLFSIPYSILIGMITGMLNIIPFLGLYVSLGLALLSSFFTPAPHISALKILLIFAIVQGVEAYIISPKIVGDRVGLHPVAVIFSIFIFSHFLGFWGLLIAVPCAALIKFLLDEWKRHQNWKEQLAVKIQRAKN